MGQTASDHCINIQRSKHQQNMLSSMYSAVQSGAPEVTGVVCLSNGTNRYHEILSLE
jgi:hypothetical protein